MAIPVPRFEPTPLDVARPGSDCFTKARLGLGHPFREPLAVTVHEVLRQHAFGIERRLRLGGGDPDQLGIEFLRQIAGDPEPCVVGMLELEVHHQG